MHMAKALYVLVSDARPGSSQIVLYREQEVLDCDCDMASVHHLLSQIPQDLPYETLISRAGDLFVQFPPSELARKAAAQQQAAK